MWILFFKIIVMLEVFEEWRWQEYSENSDFEHKKNSDKNNSDKNNESLYDSNDWDKEKKENSEKIEESRTKIKERYNVLKWAYPNGFEKNIWDQYLENENIKTRLKVSYPWEWKISLQLFQIKNSKDNWENGWESTQNFENIDEGGNQLKVSLWTIVFENFLDVNNHWNDSLQWTDSNNQVQWNPMIPTFTQFSVNDKSFLDSLRFVNENNWLEHQNFDINDLNSVVNFVDTSIMKSEVDNVYWYMNHLIKDVNDYVLDHTLEEWLNDLDISWSSSLVKCLLDKVKNDSDIPEWKLFACKVLLALCVLVRSSSDYKDNIAKALGLKLEENKDSFVKSLTTWEDLLEILTQYTPTIMQQWKMFIDLAINECNQKDILDCLNK